MTERDLFISALQKDATQRQAYLDQACAGDPELRARVEELLRLEANAGSFLERQPVPEATGVFTPSLGEELPGVREGPGACVGPYRLLEQIGAGGFGVVFMAEQREPIRRKVALKVLKPGMDSAQVVARFEAERQALALMDHPNIARVFDGGTTENGRPYFVMELVKGIPITELCDQEKRTTRERLELFVEVCQAVQHAHQKGVIHRDIKPSNVLVTLHDGKPVVKVIDFGIAKALGQQLTDKTLFTGFAQMIGTPLYMSPEQAALSGLDVDTRSDVYSLGVLLYELLTGTTPFDADRLRQAGYDEMRRIIREEEPPRPSTRLSTLGEAATPISAQRGSNPVRLSQTIRGELDWIVMKALEKDRNRRYESPSAFAADVQRYLNDEPVLACPPSVGYRLKKLVRRNKTALAITGLILFFIAVLGGGSGWVLRDREAREEEVKRDQEAREEKRRRQVADTGQKTALALSRTRENLDHERLPEAAAAIAEAEAHMASGETDAVTREQVREARRYVDLVAKIDDVRFYSTPESQKVWSKEQERRFKELFGDLGIDVDAMSPEEAASRIKTHALSRQLASALESWSYARRLHGTRKKPAEKKWWQRPLLVANEVDPDPTRSRVRTAYIAGDDKVPREMAAAADVGRLPAATLLQLARALYTDGTTERKEMAIWVLKLGDALQPGHFGLNMTLTSYLLYNPVPRPEEALAYARVAQAIRPTNRQAPALVGMILIELKRPREALVVYTAAVERFSQDAWAWSNRAAAHNHLRQWRGTIADASRALELDPKLGHAWINRGSAYLNMGLQSAGREPKITQEFFRKAVEDLSTGIQLGTEEPIIRYARGVAYEQLGETKKAHEDFTQLVQMTVRSGQDLICRGYAYETLGNRTKALADYSGAIALLAQDPVLIPEDAEAWYLRGTLYAQYLKQFDRALADFDQAIKMDARRSTAWLSRGLVHLERKEWQAAIQDLSKYFELEPEKAKTPPVALFWYQRGAAHYQLGHRDQAALDFSRALALNPKLTSAWHYRALVKCQKGQYQEAIDDYSRAIALKPGDADLRVARGSVYCDNLKQYDLAIKDFTEAIRINKNAYEAWHNLGWTYLQMGQHDEAVANYSRALELKPDYFKARMARGSIYCDHLKQYDRAIVDFTRAVTLEPKNAKAHSNLARALHAGGRLEEAISSFRKAAQLQEDHGTYNLLGNALFDRGQTDEAIAAYQKAIGIKKDEASYHFNLGNALVKKNRPDEAITELRTAIRLREKFADAYMGLGIALSMKGRLDDAIQTFETAIRLNGNEPKAFYNYGKVLHDRGRLDDAIKAFENAIRLQENGPSYCAALGDALRDRGRTDDAITAYQKAIRINDKDIGAHNGLGMAYQDKNLLDDAIAEHQKAIHLDHKLPDPHNCLGVAYARKNRMDDALAEFRKVIALDQNHVGAHANIGNVCHARGDRPGAIAAYRKAIAVDEKYAPAHYNLANVLRETGDRAGARAAYQRAIALQPDHVMARWNLGHLLQQEGDLRAALTQLRLSHKLGSRDPRWAAFTIRGVRKCERLIELDGKLPRILDDKITPESNAERIELAELCSLKHLHHAEARFYEEVFAREPRLADNLDSGHRYSAACAAALAGCGQGKDTDKLGDKERTRRRRQALDWLRADLEAWRLRLAKEPDRARPVVVARMKHWQMDTDFAGVRGQKELDRFPEAERQAWLKLWQDVADTLSQAQPRTSPEKKPGVP